MAQQGQSYASLFAGAAPQPKASPTPAAPTQQQRPRHTKSSARSTRRVPRPTSNEVRHTPKTSSPESKTYVLTLLTDSPHHGRMTALRKKYFPAELNKLEAHLTLFHALPGSRLSPSIRPLLVSVAAETSPFSIRAVKPFKIRQGVGIAVDREGCERAKEVHALLQEEWREFLSEQDAKGEIRVHYTIMNKVDTEEVVDRAFQEVTEGWRTDKGYVEGLSLFEYVKGRW